MSRILKPNKGSAIITAIGLGFVLTIIIIMLHIFTSFRVQTVVREGRNAKALAIAEAGLELIISELYTNSNFCTHKLNSDLTWSSALNRTSTIKNNSSHKLTIDNKTSGTYSGKLGDGEFKVRVGVIPYADNPNTKTVDESKAFLMVESYGKYEETVRKVEAYLNRKYPAREFLMYDGGVLSLVFGQQNKTNKNIFSVGHLYGHKGIEIGQISMSRHNKVSPGTNQELNEMNAILSGSGGIYIYSPIKSKFFAKNTNQLVNFTIPKNCDFPTNGTYEDPKLEEYGAFPNELLNELPKIPETLKPWIKDKSDGFSISPRTPAFELYKGDAEKSDGLYISDDKNTTYLTKYRMPSNWIDKDSSGSKTHLEVAYLDFGTEIHEGNVKVPENGIIYSDKDIVIKGNPHKNVSIVSTKNVFIAGDFNQRGDPSNPDHRYGFPQDYDNNALVDHDYRKSLANLLKGDGDSAKENKHHQAAVVVAKERIVYDYRSPVDCFENEIYPYMKYALAKELTGDESFARANCLNKNRSNFNCSSDSTEDFKDKFKEFFKKHRLDDTAKENAIIDSFATVYDSSDGEISFDEYDNLCKDLWQAYAKNYESSDGRGALSDAAKTLDYGVYTLLDGLKGELGIPSIHTGQEAKESKITDTPGDYIYYPEITCNGMFISCGVQNNTYYAGPDVIKYYNKIGGLHDKVVSLKHSLSSHFIHRMYGSEVNLRIYDVHRIESPPFSYVPPTRRKIYDESLPTLGLEDEKNYELAGFIVLSWKNYNGDMAEYKDF